MLEMDEGRVSFAEALRPPAGYQVSFAVGTTYSLDLRALLGLCIPLGLGFEPEALTSINPVSLFAALQKLQGKLTVYCDKGGIKADIPSDARSSGLLTLLEGMVHQVHVNTGNPGTPSSFHPKVWVVEYEATNGEGRKWRLLVMSRNLTFDTSWDTVVTMDGKQGEPNACSAHVADFLRFLADGSGRINTEHDDTRKRNSHSARLHRMADDLLNVRFLVDNKSFDSVDFLPFGPQWQGGSTLLHDVRKSELVVDSFRNALVVSPFLSNGAGSPLVEMAKHRSGELGRFVLISREDSLSQLSDDIVERYDCYCPVPALSDVELDGEDGVDAADYSNLHAKMYFTEDRGSRRALYIGSLNASTNGTINNVEALIKLSVRKGYHTFASVLKPLIGDGGKEPAPFSPYIAPETVEPEDASEKDFSRAFRIGSKLVSFRSVSVDNRDDSMAIDVALTIAWAGSKCEGITFALRPLLHTTSCDIPIGRRQDVRMRFEGLAPTQVSAMFILSGKDGEGHSGSCVLVCPHDRFNDAGFSLESRSKLLLSEILAHDNGALAQYLAHAFDLPEAGYALGEEDSSSTATSAKRTQVVPPGLYERLLDMADTNPSMFARASDLMGLIPKGVHEGEIDALRAMVDTFVKAVS